MRRTLRPLVLFSSPHGVGAAVDQMRKISALQANMRRRWSFPENFSARFQRYAGKHGRAARACNDLPTPVETMLSNLHGGYY
jgi:hypothetical protein